ncbi:hypothetical protein G6F22_020580 [Rhizopus arrhizus]|nr:hypothetical protein G6F22_020580 [Rhizopus arrhizus]
MLPARTRSSASRTLISCTGLGAFGLSMARPLPRMSSTQSMVMPLARRALARSNCTRRPLDSAAIAPSSCGASWKFGWKPASMVSCSAAPGASASAPFSISTAAGVTVMLGGVRSGAARPSTLLSSPLAAICSTMSLPPTSSPSMYSCGMVGQSP